MSHFPNSRWFQNALLVFGVCTFPGARSFSCQIASNPRAYHRNGTQRTVLQSTAVERLLREVDQSNSHSAENLIEQIIVSGKDGVGNGSMSDANDEEDAESDFLGLYEVAFVKTIKDGENPVGGAWTRKSGILGKLFKQRRSFQHILGRNETGLSKGTFAASGEVVNVVSLSMFWDIIRTTVILRGDILPLTPTERGEDKYGNLTKLAVRADFDSPRIVFGRRGRMVNLNVGPKTSLVLDTPYVDDKVRIGVGARSGTRFVFRRCSVTDDEANEFRRLLQRKPANKVKLVALLSSVSAAGVFGVAKGFRVVGSTLASLSLLSTLLVTLSGGGIESGDKSVGESKSLYASQNKKNAQQGK